jgi:hypothetical protein
LIAGNLRKQFASSPIVNHLHDTSYIPPVYYPPTERICVLSKRKNVFKAVLSLLVLEVTGEPSSYTNKTIEPFTIDLRTFKAVYISHLTFYKQINLSHYDKVIEVWFDELISDPYYLFKQFDITAETDYTVIEKSPYKYQELVTNINELKDWAVFQFGEITGK